MQMREFDNDVGRGGSRDPGALTRSSSSSSSSSRLTAVNEHRATRKEGSISKLGSLNSRSAPSPPASSFVELQLIKYMHSRQFIASVVSISPLAVFSSDEGGGWLRSSVLHIWSNDECSKLID